MAVHVINEPYNPWREYLAMQFFAPAIQGIGNRIGDAIFDAPRRQKETALYHDVAERMRPQTQVNTSIQTPYMDKFQQIFDVGGDRDLLAWWDNPVTKSGLLPPSVRGETPLQATAGNGVGGVLPNPWEQFKAPEVFTTPGQTSFLDILAGTDKKRFRSIDPDRMHQIIGNVMGMHQQEQDRARLDEILGGIATGNFDINDMNSFLAQLLGLHRYGGLDSQAMGHVLTGANNRYQHDNPHKTFSTVDTGDKIRGVGFNPKTGSAIDAWEASVGMSPYERGSLGVQHARNNIDSRRRFGTPFVDAEGKAWLIDQFTGEPTDLDITGVPRETTEDRQRTVQNLKKQLDDYYLHMGKPKPGTEEAVKVILRKMAELTGIDPKYAEMVFLPDNKDEKPKSKWHWRNLFDKLKEQPPATQPPIQGPQGYIPRYQNRNIGYLTLPPDSVLTPELFNKFLEAGITPEEMEEDGFTLPYSLRNR